MKIVRNPTLRKQANEIEDCILKSKVDINLRK